MTKHLLGMVAIVKDESANVERLLASVKPLFDTYTIVDTGSSDDTVQLLTDALPPGSVHERPWVNFSHNLNEALVLARNKSDWLLRVDADQTVEYAPNFTAWLSEQSLEDGYNVQMVESGTCWRLPRLLRGNLRWEFKEPTHEYLDTEGRAFRDLAGLTIIHHADGGSRADKFKRDIALLSQGVARSEARATFYTAECYRFLGDFENAFELYTLRSQMENTWEEERWYAQYRAGCCMMQIDPQRGIPTLMAAWHARPSRSEPLMRIREFCDTNRIQDISSDALFVEPSAYR